MPVSDMKGNIDLSGNFMFLEIDKLLCLNIMTGYFFI